MPERVEAAGDPHADREPDRGHQLRGRLEAEAERLEAVVELDGEVLPQLTLAEPVERDGPDHHDHHPDRARHRVEPRQAAEERARADHAVARLEHRQAREEVEVDRERLAQARPRLDAEHAHEDQRQHAVAGDRGGERGRLLAPARAELDPGEAEQPDRGRPAPERLRVVAQPAVAEQHAPDRPPRVEGAEQVAEQHAGEHEPDPEDDEDEGRREVVQRRVGPVVAGHEHEREQQHAERAADDLDRLRAQHAPDPARQRPPARRARAAAAATARRARRTRRTGRPPPPTRKAIQGSAGSSAARARGRRR